MTMGWWRTFPVVISPVQYLDIQQLMIYCCQAHGKTLKSHYYIIILNIIDIWTQSTVHNATKLSENLTPFFLSNAMVIISWTRTGTARYIKIDQTMDNLTLTRFCAWHYWARVLLWDIVLLSPGGFYCGFDKHFVRVYVADCAPPALLGIYSAIYSAGWPENIQSHQHLYQSKDN